MKGRFIALVAAFVGALAMVAPSAAAPPAASSVQIERQATFVSPGSIVVTVVFTCPAGTASSVRATVSQQQAVGPNTNGASFMNVMCTGSNQTVNMLVTGGPFAPGEAFAAAQLVSNFLAEFAQDSRVIDIS
jgi:hypothetical protein